MPKAHPFDLDEKDSTALSFEINEYDEQWMLVMRLTDIFRGADRVKKQKLQKRDALLSHLAPANEHIDP